MPKIRKQPRRLGKKLRVQSLKNPFLQQNLHYLPASIAKNLKHLQRIVLRHIDQIVCEPIDPPQMNIQFMKQALYQQQLKITGLKCVGVCSTRKKSITQAQIEIQGAREEKSSHEELQAPVEADNLEWMLHQNQSIDFF